MLKLQFKDQRKPAIWLVETRYAIGRDAQNNIVIADEGVSPFHAELRIEGDQVFISDTGSSNGTFVNGKRIARRTELRSADVISIHTVQLMLVDPKQEHAAAPEGATAITPALANIPIAAGTATAKTGSLWLLKAKTGSLVGKSYPVPTTGKVIIGRANNCDIQLPANHVSRQHAELQVTGGRLMVKDLNSSNGTFINRKKVAEGELKNGDEVRFDTFSFEVVGPGADATAQADEGERTQIQPGVNQTASRPRADAAEPATAAGKQPSPTATTRIQTKLDVPAEAAASQARTPAAESSGGNSMMIVVVLVALAGAAAWFFLG